MNKISVLVVDDEPLLLKGLISIIEKANPNFKIVGTAYDGREALEKVEVLHPQVVFTDIKMPGMDGLNFLLLAKKQFPGFVPVILSGHDDFEYARKSLQLGVAEYLLKPVRLASLKTLLNTLYEKIQYQLLLDQISLLKSLMSNQIDTRKISSLFGNYSCFSCVLISAGSFHNYKVKSIEPSRDFWLKNDLESILEGALKKSYDLWVLDLEYENQEIIVFATEKAFTSDDIAKQNLLYDRLIELNFPITYVFGKPFTNLQELCSQVNDRQHLLIKNSIFSKSLKIDQDLPNKSNYKINRTFYENLLNTNQLSLFIQHSLNYIRSLEELSCLQINLEEICKQLITMLYNKISNMQNVFYSDIVLEVSEIINFSFTYSQLLKRISDIFEKLLHINNNLPLYQTDHQQLANNIQVYIENNFHKQITLGTLSNIYGLVPPYLSKIFSTYKGISPIDYLTEVRINEAKKLLLSSPSFLLKDVTQLVGYDDPYNFSKIFKKNTGKSPSEYRNNQQIME